MNLDEAEQFGMAMRQAFAAWPMQGSKYLTEEIVAAWYAALREFPMREVVRRLEHLSRTEKWPPSLSDVRGPLASAARSREVEQRQLASRQEMARALPMAGASSAAIDPRAVNEARYSAEIARLVATGMEHGAACCQIVMRGMERRATVFEPRQAPLGDRRRPERFHPVPKDGFGPEKPATRPAWPRDEENREGASRVGGGIA